MTPDTLPDFAGSGLIAFLIGVAMLAERVYAGWLRSRKARRKTDAEAAREEADADLHATETDARVSAILREELDALRDRVRRNEATHARELDRLEKKHDREVAELRKENDTCQATAEKQARFIATLQSREKARQMMVDGLTRTVAGLKAQLRAHGWADGGSDEVPVSPDALAAVRRRVSDRPPDTSPPVVVPYPPPADDPGSPPGLKGLPPDETLRGDDETGPARR